MEAVTKGEVDRGSESCSAGRGRVAESHRQPDRREDARRAPAKKSLRSAQKRLAGASDEVAVRARAAADATDEYVHENPWQAIGIAAGVAFLVGYLIGRR